MKHISFLQVGLLSVLMVFAASCGLPIGASGDTYEESPIRSDRYYGNGYYGAPNTIIVERDPYTGQYYQVAPGRFGNRFGTSVSPYGRRVYRSTNRSYNDRNFNNRGNNNVRRTYPQTTQPVKRAPQQQKIEQREQAKESILGKKRN